MEIASDELLDLHPNETEKSLLNNFDIAQKKRLEGFGFLEKCMKLNCDGQLHQTLLERASDGSIEEYVECEKCKTQYCNIYKPETWREL